jgi:hypothetical protein
MYTILLCLFKSWFAWNRKKQIQCKLTVRGIYILRYNYNCQETNLSFQGKMINSLVLYKSVLSSHEVRQALCVLKTYSDSSPLQSIQMI